MAAPRPRRGSRRNRSSMVYRGGPSSGGKRTPPAPKVPRERIDWDAVGEVLSRPPVIRKTGGSDLPVTGECYDCGRRVSGERRFCGPCLAAH